MNSDTNEHIDLTLNICWMYKSYCPIALSIFNSFIQVPIIMVGPGTGLAPFRGFLQERQYQRVTENKQVGDSHLFYGCRKSSEDFLYREELEAFVADGTCTLYTAFSREQEHKVC